MKKIILDNNLWISFVIGKRLSVLRDIIMSPDNIIYVCDELIEEFEDVIKRPKIKKYINGEDVSLAVLLMKQYCHKVVIEKVAETPIRDAKDLYLLSLAEAVGADYILTGDKDLLVLESYKGTLILSFTEYLKSNYN